MSRQQIRMFATGLALGVLLGVGIAWAAFRQPVPPGAAPPSDQPDPVEAAKVERAKEDMRAIEKACMAYYAHNAMWPDLNDLATDIGPLLAKGKTGLVDPWGGRYAVAIHALADPDGECRQRPVVSCQPPGGKTLIQGPGK